MFLFERIREGTRPVGAQLWDRVQVSPAMANSLQEWLNAFYQVPWEGHRLSGLPVLLTGHISTLSVNELEVHCGDSDRAGWLEKQLDPLLCRLKNAVQLAAASGQVLLRPVVVGTHLEIETVQAGRFYPLRMNSRGGIEAGFFCDWEENDRGEWLRTEEFDYTPETRSLSITNRVWRCRDGTPGGEVPLTEVARWTGLAPFTVLKDCDGPLFGVLRMPFANTVDDASPLPVSLYANALDNIREFDALYSEFLYELHSGKRKRIVEREAIRPRGSDRLPGAIPVGLTYRDLTTDTYLVLDPEEPGKPFDDYSPALRTDGYLTGLKTVLALIESQCGISPGTFGLDGRSGAITATQVISQDRTTYNTCAAVQVSIRQALTGLISACCYLADLYELSPAGAVTPTITFGDSVFEDTAQEFDRRLRMVQAGILKPELLLSWYFGTDEEQARKLLKGGGPNGAA